MTGGKGRSAIAENLQTGQIITNLREIVLDMDVFVSTYYISRQKYKYLYHRQEECPASIPRQQYQQVYQGLVQPCSREPES